MQETTEFISIGISVETFTEILNSLTKQIKAYEGLINKCQTIIENNRTKNGNTNKNVNAVFMPLMAFLDTLRLQSKQLYDRLCKESGIYTVMPMKENVIMNKNGFTQEYQDIKTDIENIEKSAVLDAYLDLAEAEELNEITTAVKKADKILHSNKIVYNEVPKWKR